MVCALWYTMRLTEIGEDRESVDVADLGKVVVDYDKRDQSRVALWLDEFR